MVLSNHSLNAMEISKLVDKEKDIVKGDRKENLFPREIIME